MNLEEFIKILEEPESLQPIVNQAKKVIDLYAPEINSIMDRALMAICESKVKVIRYYESEGFTKDDALLLVMDQWYGIARAMESKKTT
jgi:hypothetical protein